MTFQPEYEAMVEQAEAHRRLRDKKTEEAHAAHLNFAEAKRKAAELFYAEKGIKVGDSIRVTGGGTVTHGPAVLTGFTLNKDDAAPTFRQVMKNGETSNFTELAPRGCTLEKVEDDG